jgi:hypothetical protein
MHRVVLAHWLVSHLRVVGFTCSMVVRLFPRKFANWGKRESNDNFETLFAPGIIDSIIIFSFLELERCCITLEAACFGTLRS